MTDATEGAILQRDGKTYAVTTRIPAGIITPEQLETIAKVGRKYHVPVLKVTSGLRVLLAGIQPEDVSRVFADLGPLAKPETAPCVKFVHACIGTDMCKYGKQDSIGLARTIENHFKDQSFPAKIKIGVSGCPRCCSESHTRDIGIIGTTKGWMVFFGGNGGTRPRFGDLIAWDLTAGEAVDCAQRLSEYYRSHANKHERTARFMERIGIDTLKSELLTLIPYIPIEKVN
ncbi:MAG: NAD(P)/FAD-dependent oxidoreductase [Methanoregulaceae archaeon]|jgi:NAD(P)H-nitrite reductase large subunit|nr:NAD(P)/FAD-dependent oxidoreductase [Methanoregulaceae archaeon]